ncbi:hypothetical protein FHU29_000408 [Hoyosella altamirensis]|uniref:Uncharacterized protein n=1 Tax=Hoyosella altamirensis TaxID=616997 RepID=A0A839RIF6_9ACTN|nr:hypothetical protein [Hoyosella altamirensis]
MALIVNHTLLPPLHPLQQLRQLFHRQRCTGPRAGLGGFAPTTGDTGIASIRAAKSIICFSTLCASAALPGVRGMQKPVYLPRGDFPQQQHP